MDTLVAATTEPMAEAREDERVARLRGLGVLDSPNEPLFDALAQAAATVAGVPIALLSLVDADRQWFKANVGLDGTAQTPREVSFCAHAIQGDDAVMEVPDARDDRRFADNPLVRGAPQIRFYAGAPIVLSDGLRMGALCVIDRAPRTLDDNQRAVLAQLARAAAEALEQRVRARDREASLQREADAGMRLAHIIEASGAGTCEWNPRSGEVRCNTTWLAMVPARADAAEPAPWLRLLHPDDRARLAPVLAAHLRDEIPIYAGEARIPDRDGGWRWIHDRARVTSRDASGTAAWMFGRRVDIDARKRTEQALADSEARMRQLYEATPAMLHSIDAQGRLLSVSDRWLERLGYAREDVLGRRSVEFLTETSRELAERMLAQFFRNGRVDRVPYRMVCKDGEIVDVELSAVLERDADGAPVRSMAIIEDVTARRSAERKLLASEAFLERTNRLAGVGGWELDLDSNALTWSNETCRIHDVPPGHRPNLEEALGYYAPEARATIEAAVRQGIEDGTGWDLELPMVTATGRGIWGRAVGSVEFEDGRARRLVGAIQDITLRRRAVLSLEASERRFRSLFQHSLGLICTHDLDGVILSVNPAAARSLGFSIADMMGRRLDELMRPKYREEFGAYLEQIAEAGTASGMLQLIGADGHARLWQYHNVLDRESEAPYVLGHAQDVTERQEHMQQLRDWSLRDALTGAYNRRYLGDLDAALRDDDRWGAIAIDLDKFKQVNDTLGHQRGDEVLVEMATFLMAHTRPDDAVVRLGGDEFVLLLHGADADALARVAQRLDEDRASAPIAFTMGWTVRTPGQSLRDTLAEADARLYGVRAARRNAG